MGDRITEIAQGRPRIIDIPPLVWSGSQACPDASQGLQDCSGFFRSLILGWGVNDAGQITGYGAFNGVNHAFRLDPAPPYNAFVQQPINPDGSSIFNASRGVIPVKFTLSLNGTATCQLRPATISLTRTAGGTLGTVDESTYLQAADSGANFRISGCQYVYNLEAKSLGSGAYRVDITINGSVVGSGVFALK